MSGAMFRFLLVGVVNTAFGLGTIFALKALAGWGDVPANVAGYAVGLCVSFVLNRHWTFAHRGDWRPALVRFLLVFAVAYVANLAVLLALRDPAGVGNHAAHVAGMVVYTVIFFVGSRAFAFRDSHSARGVAP
jgi:putative flippase GtrA